MISAEHKQSIINTGVDFIRAITECYGSEDGMKLWDQIAQTLDPSVKGDIFFAILCGTGGKTLHVSGIVPDRIAAIKAIREVTLLGLREAKDLHDDMQSGGKVRLDLHTDIDRNIAVYTLRRAGLTVD